MKFTLQVLSGGWKATAFATQQLITHTCVKLNTARKWMSIYRQFSDSEYLTFVFCLPFIYLSV